MYFDQGRNTVRLPLKSVFFSFICDAMLQTQIPTLDAMKLVGDSHRIRQRILILILEFPINKMQTHRQKRHNLHTIHSPQTAGICMSLPCEREMIFRSLYLIDNGRCDLILIDKANYFMIPSPSNRNSKVEIKKSRIHKHQLYTCINIYIYRA